MKLLKWCALIVAILLGVLVLTGQIYQLFAWCDTNIGGWFVPVAIMAACLLLIIIPLGRGVWEGMKEAAHKD